MNTLRYTTRDEDDAETIAEALREAAEDRRGYTATPSPSSSVAEAAEDRPDLATPPPAAPPPVRGDDIDVSPGISDEENRFYDDMERYRRGEGPLPDLLPEDRAYVERETARSYERGYDDTTPEPDYDGMTEREFMEWSESSDPLSPDYWRPSSTQERATPEEEPVGKLTMGRGTIKGGTSKGPAEEAAELLSDYDMSALDELENGTPTGPGSSFVGDVPAGDDDPGLVMGALDEEDADPSASDEAAALLADYDMGPLERLAAGSGDGAAFVPSGIDEPLEIVAGAAYPPDDDEAAEASMGIADDELAEVYPSGEGFNDPDTSAPGDAYSDTGEGATEWDAMMGALDGMAFEDGSIEGLPGSGDDALAQGADEADRGADGVFAYEYATDEDPELPGRARPEGLPGAQGPGGWADDDPVLGSGRALGDPRMPAEASGGLEATSAPKTPTEPGTDPLALDYGLPSEGAIDEANVWDAIRRPFHAIGSGLLAASGRSTTPFRSSAEPLAEERREGIRGRLDAKGATAAADRRAAMDAEARRAAREPTDFEREVEARRAAGDAARTETDARRVALDERRVAGTEARTAEEAARAERMRDPASAESVRARQLLDLEVNTLSPVIRDAIRALDLSDLNAEQADAYRRDLTGLIRDRLGRGRGAAGGGGGSGGSPTTEALRQMLTANGRMTDEQADAYIASMGRRRVASSLLSDTLSMGRADAAADRRDQARAAGDELVEGVHASVHMSEPAIRAWQNGWGTTRASMDSLRAIEAMVEENGIGTVINPELRNRLEARMFPLRGMAAAAQGTGVINPSEMPAINAALPDATSMVGMTLGQFRGALNEWRRLTEDAIRHRMEDMGVPDEEVRRALGALRSGSRVVRGGSARTNAEAPAGGEGAAPAGDTVRVRLPSGRTANLPRDVYEAHRDEVEVIE